MEKFEYGDYYKFIVSLGIALVLVSGIFVWLFLLEPFDLLVESSTLEALTETARKAVLQRQQMIATVLPFVPWAGLLLFVSQLVEKSFLEA